MGGKGRSYSFEPGGQEGISEKVTLELRPKGGRVVGRAQILERSVPSRSKAKTKALR